MVGTFTLSILCYPQKSRRAEKEKSRVMWQSSGSVAAALSYDSIMIFSFLLVSKYYFQTNSPVHGVGV